MIKCDNYVEFFYAAFTLSRQSDSLPDRPTGPAGRASTEIYGRELIVWTRILENFVLICNLNEEGRMTTTNTSSEEDTPLQAASECALYGALRSRVVYQYQRRRSAPSASSADCQQIAKLTLHFEVRSKRLPQLVYSEPRTRTFFLIAGGESATMAKGICTWNRKNRWKKKELWHRLNYELPLGLSGAEMPSCGRRNNFSFGDKWRSDIQKPEVVSHEFL